MGFVSQKKVGSQTGADVIKENGNDDELGSPVRLTVTVKSVKHSNESTGFFVFEGKPILEKEKIIVDGIVYLNETVNVQGISESFAEHSRIGQVMDCVGYWKVNEKYGIQFEALFINEQLPNDTVALEKYLASGRLKGITPKVAKTMVEKWGMECVDILDYNIEKLLEIKKMTDEKLQDISEQWKEKRNVYKMVSYLGQYGISESASIKVYRFFNLMIKQKRIPNDRDPIDIIKKNPYVLTKVDGFGFLSADKVGMGLGFQVDDILRLKAALVYKLEESTHSQGNTCIPVKEWLESCVYFLRAPLENVKAIAQQLINNKEIVLREVPCFFTRHENGKVIIDTRMETCISPMSLYNSEKMIAYTVKNMLKTKVVSDDDIEYIRKETQNHNRVMDDSQRKAAFTVLTSPISVLTGGPGTGKTTTLKNIVNILTALKRKIVLVSPTGKAAKRMTETIGMEAKTIHRELGFMNGTFEKNRANKLEGNVFIIDESSMLDTFLCASWMAAIPQGAQLIFVGDADQLPSVGPGDVLRDLIKSNKIPVARLTQIHRQAKGSGIALNAKNINEGFAPEKNGNIKVDDFVFLEVDNDEGIQDKIFEVIDELLEDGVLHKDIQVLAPQRSKEVGTEMLNSLLRWQLNPEAPNPESIEVFPHFFNGERVMQIVNNYENEIFNGDMGYVSDFKEDNSFKYTTIDDREIYMTSANFKELEMGYAQTVHKSQGSESLYIIMPISKSHAFTLNRNNIYTGVTRAKVKVILIGQYDVLISSIRKLEQRLRKTGLIKEINS